MYTGANGWGGGGAPRPKRPQPGRRAARCQVAYPRRRRGLVSKGTVIVSCCTMHSPTTTVLHAVLILYLLLGGRSYRRRRPTRSRAPRRGRWRCTPRSRSSRAPVYMDTVANQCSDGTAPPEQARVGSTSATEATRGHRARGKATRGLHRGQLTGQLLRVADTTSWPA